MNPKIKDYLGIAIIGALIIVALAGMQYAAAFSRSVPSAASFSVSGEGKINSVPDVAEFSFGITTEGGKDVAALQEDNTSKANAAIDYVKSKGVDPKDISTQNYNINPRYSSCPGVVYGPSSVAPASAPCTSEIVGYTVSQTVRVKVRDFKNIGDLLSGVATRGANNVSDLRFTIDEPTEVQNQARAEAISEAKRKAKDLAKAGGFRLGRILSVQEGGATAPYPYYEKAMLGRGAADAVSAPAIEPGSQDVTSTVTVTYEIR